jgi:heat shock protein HslJ
MCKLAIAGLVWILAGSCGASGPSASAHGEVRTLEIAPTTVECVGESVGRCLRVREVPEGEWRTFYSAIEGFTHEEGVRYTVDVLRSERANPPADASRYTYRLLRVISREPAEP